MTTGRSASRGPGHQNHESEYSETCRGGRQRVARSARERQRPADMPSDRLTLSAGTWPTRPATGLSGSGGPGHALALVVLTEATRSRCDGARAQNGERQRPAKLPGDRPAPQRGDLADSLALAVLTEATRSRSWF